MKYVLLIFIAMGFDTFSDVYFRTMHHTAGGVTPHSYDLVTTLLILGAVVGLVADFFLKVGELEIQEGLSDDQIRLIVAEYLRKNP